MRPGFLAVTTSDSNNLVYLFDEAPGKGVYGIVWDGARNQNIADAAVYDALSWSQRGLMMYRKVSGPPFLPCM